MAELILWRVFYNNIIKDTQHIEIASKDMNKDLFSANHLEIIAIQDYQHNKIDVNEWKDRYYDSNS